MSDTPNSNAPVGNSTEQTNAQDSNEQESNTQQEITPAVAKKIKQLKLKVDGQEFEENLPFEIDENNKEQVEYLKRHLQISKAANKRMQEAAKVKSQTEQLIKMLQEDPVKVLSHDNFGGEKRFRQLAEDYITKQLEEQLLSPEERQKRDMEIKLREYEQQEKERKQQIETQQMEQLQSHYAQEFEKTIITGLQSQGIPKTPRTVKRMAELMSKNLQHGLDLGPEQLAQLVKEDYINEMKEMFGAAEGDILLNLLGDDVSNKIRKADLAKLKASGINLNRNNSPNQNPSSDKSRKVMSRDEWRDYIDKKSKE